MRFLLQGGVGEEAQAQQNYVDDDLIYHPLMLQIYWGHRPKKIGKPTLLSPFIHFSKFHLVDPRKGQP